MSRLDRVASLIKSEISLILSRKINDSRIGFISILEVELSKDLGHAWIHYSQIGSEEEKQRTKKGLSSATKFIQAELFKVLDLQTIPKIHFKFDPSLEKGVDLVTKITKLEA